MAALTTTWDSCSDVLTYKGATDVMLKRRTTEEHDPLFDTPEDLLCPITREFLVDPVINEVGQVYERGAIEQHLKVRNTDPITNKVLTSTSLTPVYIIKSRALEFRERVARQCVERACSLHCKSPIKYLRRAAELCAHADIKLPGVSRPVVSYLLSHPSDAYEPIALKFFADELKRSGQLDQAANVYYRLLRFGDDRAQQADALKQCIACWLAQDDGAAVAEGQQQQEGPQQGCGGGARGRGVVLKLAQFIRDQEQFSTGQIMDIMQEAHMDAALILQVCDHLLSSGSDTDIRKQLGLLVKFVQLSCGQVSSQVQEMLERKLPAEAAAAASEAVAAGGAAACGADGDAAGGRPRWHGAVLNGRGAASVVLGVATLFGGNAPVARLGQLLPLLFLLHRKA